MTTWECLGRELKAAKLADWLIANKFTAAEVRQAVSEDDSWRFLSASLGIRKPSLETRMAVVQQMEIAEMQWAGVNTNDAGSN